MEKVRCFGSLAESDWCNQTEFNNIVSVSFDTTECDINAKYKVLVQIEPPELINPKGFIENAHNFDLILSWNTEILEICPNSEKFVFGTCWIDIDTFVPNKTNEISFITSHKRMTNGHLLRHEIFQTLPPNYGDFTIRKMMTPPRIPNKGVMFTNAKYAIIVENVCRDNWFTEKLIDCLSTKTIPIYYGCPNIGNYFNCDGILSFNTIDELHSILNKLTPEFYDNQSTVIDENYEKSLQYHNLYGRVTESINKLID